MMCVCTTATAANTIVADTGAAGSMMLVGMTYETRWISHKLGPIQMGAYSIAHSAKNYVENVRALWGGSTAKIGRAVGADDDAEGGVSTARRVRSDGGVVGINRARERRRETDGGRARARRGTLRSQVAEAELAKELVTTRRRTRVKNSSK